MPSSKAKQFRKRAEDCCLQAQKSEDRDSKTFWLDLAKRWETHGRQGKRVGAVRLFEYLSPIYCEPPSGRAGQFVCGIDLDPPVGRMR